MLMPMIEWFFKFAAHNHAIIIAAGGGANCESVRRAAPAALPRLPMGALPALAAELPLFIPLPFADGDGDGDDNDGAFRGRENSRRWSDCGFCGARAVPASRDFDRGIGRNHLV